MKENKFQKWIKLFTQMKWGQFLVFLGLRISDDWFLLRAINRKHGSEKAKALLTSSILLKLKYGTKYNKQIINEILIATKFGAKNSNERKQIPKTS